MGRSRGGLTTKIHALLDAEGRPVRLALTAGQADDAPAAEGLLAMLAPAALRWGAVGLAVLLFLLSLRRAGERAGRMAERLEATERSNDVHCRMLEAAARRPRGRDELARRLRDGHF